MWYQPDVVVSQCYRSHFVIIINLQTPGYQPGFLYIKMDIGNSIYYVWNNHDKALFRPQSRHDVMNATRPSKYAMSYLYNHIRRNYLGGISILALNWS